MVLVAVLLALVVGNPGKPSTAFHSNNHCCFRRLLRDAETYDSAGGPLPTITYEHKSSKKLAALRQQFHLDSVCGNGSEIERMVQLLHWVHRTIPHDGANAIGGATNTIDLMAKYRQEHRGLDCRGLATILNEFLLSEGFESRLLTCLPKDLSDHEHHVIATAYSHTWHKWIWLDPSFGAYVTDSSNTPLTIEELRTAVATQTPGIIVRSIDSSFVEQEYIEYLAKNLYWFQFPVHSTFNAEAETGSAPVDYIALLPKGYNPFGRSQISLRHGTAYLTNNAALVWQEPSLQMNKQR